MGEIQNEGKSFEIQMPTPADLEQEKIRDLHEIWRENNARLIRALTGKRIPFFGLHGTAKENLLKIQKEGHAYVNVGTFYKQYADPHQMLVALSIIGGYTSIYAQKGSGRGMEIGGLFLIDLDKNNENVSRPWERLLYERFALTYDTEKEREYFENKAGLGWRSDTVLTRGNLKGVYNADPAYYRSSDSFEEVTENDGIARNILQTRFRTQHIVQFCLQSLNIVDVNTQPSS